MKAQQNTEFSLIEKVESVVVVAPVRCDEGKRLIHQWARRMNELAHQMRGNNDPKLEQQWEKTWGGKEYITHVSTCPTCARYELARVARYR